MADLEKIAEDLSSLTVLEAADLAKLLEDKWGVSASAPVAVATAGGAEAATATGADAVTPHLSSRSLAKSAASKTVNELKSSAIFSKSAIFFS